MKRLLFVAACLSPLIASYYMVHVAPRYSQDFADLGVALPKITQFYLKATDWSPWVVWFAWPLSLAILLKEFLLKGGETRNRINVGVVCVVVVFFGTFLWAMNLPYEKIGSIVG